jgi:hypothetical protein
MESFGDAPAPFGGRCCDGLPIKGAAMSNKPNPTVDTMGIDIG